MRPVSAFALALRTSAGGALLGWLHRRHSTWARAQRRPDGTQEVRIVVDHGYHPARVELDVGVPTVLRIRRLEDEACSELFVSELLPSSFHLAPNAETAVRFTPMAAGTFAFTCGLGMYTGVLVVRPGRDRQRHSSARPQRARRAGRGSAIDDDG